MNWESIVGVNPSSAKESPAPSEPDHLPRCPSNGGASPNRPKKGSRAFKKKTLREEARVKVGMVVQKERPLRTPPPPGLCGLRGQSTELFRPLGFMSTHHPVEDSSLVFFYSAQPVTTTPWPQEEASLCRPRGLEILGNFRYGIFFRGGSRVFLPKDLGMIFFYSFGGAWTHGGAWLCGSIG